MSSLAPPRNGHQTRIPVEPRIGAGILYGVSDDVIGGAFCISPGKAMLLPSNLEGFRHKMSYSYNGRVARDFGVNLPQSIDGTILDAGCSEGETTHELQERYPHCKVIGMDIEEKRILRCRSQVSKGTQPEFYSGDIYFLTSHFPDNTFSAIFFMNNIANVAQNLGGAECALIANRVYRCLKPEGLVYLSGNRGFGVAQKDPCGKFLPVAFDSNFQSRYSFRHLPAAFGIPMINDIGT